MPRQPRLPRAAPLAQGPAEIGSLYATANRDANVIVADFQGCRVEAFNTPMPENREKKAPSGILSSFFGQLFPRGFWTKARTPDEWALQTFAACLNRRGYDRLRRHARPLAAGAPLLEVAPRGRP